MIGNPGISLSLVLIPIIRKELRNVRGASGGACGVHPWSSLPKPHQTEMLTEVQTILTWAITILKKLGKACQSAIIAFHASRETLIAGATPSQ